MSGRRPLEIGCKASTCNEGRPADKERHAFRSPTSALPGLGGDCINCGSDDIVDWELCHNMGPHDFATVTAELRKELIRDNYWGLELPPHVLRKAAKRSRQQLEVSTALTLRRALVVNHPREGTQTTWAYNDKATIIHCAQHATGTCCRACIDKWFGIQPHLPLGYDWLTLLSEFAMSYVDVRLNEPVTSILEAA